MQDSTRSCGNIFEDVGLSDSKMLQRKSHLAIETRIVAKQLGLNGLGGITQKICDMDNREVSDLFRSKLSNFSEGRLQEIRDRIVSYGKAHGKRPLELRDKKGRLLNWPTVKAWDPWSEK